MKYYPKFRFPGGNSLRAYLAPDDDPSPLCEPELLLPVVIHGYVDSAVFGNAQEIEEVGIFVTTIGLDFETSISESDVDAFRAPVTLH